MPLQPQKSVGRKVGTTSARSWGMAQFGRILLDGGDPYERRPWLACVKTSPLGSFWQFKEIALLVGPPKIPLSVVI